MPTVSYRFCAQHGESLHGKNGCCHCARVPDAPTAAPRPESEAAKYRRRARASLNSKQFVRVPGRKGRTPSASLTHNELQAALVLKSGKSRQEAAALIGISVDAFDNRIWRARTRLDVGSTEALLERMGALDSEALFKHLVKA